MTNKIEVEADDNNGTRIKKKNNTKSNLKKRCEKKDD